MPKYTDAELICLGYCADEYFNWDDHPYEALVRDELLEQEHTDKDIIYDLIGAYVCMLSPQDCERLGMGRIAFEEPLHEMERLLNSGTQWHRIIANWRLLIEK